MKLIKALGLIFALLSFTPPGFALDAPFDHTDFDDFLKAYVNEKGDVNYAAAKEHPEKLDSYLQQLKAIDRGDFKDWPREEKIALGINAYNASLIRKVLNYYPISSIQKVADFWQMDAVRIGDKAFGLNGFRHEFLLLLFHDAKIHVVLSYGAKGGPRLSRDAFTGPKLDAQLFLAAKSFVNDAQFNQITYGAKKITISKIFEWHKNDFKMEFGTFENDRGLSGADYSVLNFLTHYLDDAKLIQYLEDHDFKIKYASFDWTLNDWKTSGVSESKPASAAGLR